MYYSKKIIEQWLKRQYSLSQLEDNLLQLGHEVEDVCHYQVNNLVVGKIVAIQDVVDSDHLHVCQVDIGTQVLQIVCGASNVKCDALVIVALPGACLGDITIQENEIKGIKSQGMLCALEELGFEKQIINPENLPYIHIFQPHEVSVGMDVSQLLNLDDSVIDVSLTANRGDCFSYIGIIRDLNALFNNYQPTYKALPTFNQLINVNYHDYQGMYYNVTSNNYNTNTQLKTLLAKHKIISYDIIHDFLALTTLLTGQTFNIYDLNNIVVNSIKIRPIGQDITTEVFVKYNTYQQVKLQAQDLGVFVNDDILIGIPGLGVIKGYEIKANTNKYLVEALNIDPLTIRKMNSHLNIKNDQSIRSEKGIDPLALNHSFHFINQFLPQNTTWEILNAYQHFNNPQQINYNPQHLQTVLGINLAFQVQYDILSRLGFQVENNPSFLKPLNNDTILIPSWRYDIENDNDLIEEIIRVYGVNKITSLPVLETITHQNMLNQAPYYVEQAINNIGLNHQLNEIITYSLISEKSFMDFNILDKKPIFMASPLSQEHSVYRHSLIPSLLDVCLYNANQKAETFNYFELANCYDDPQKLNCTWHLGALLGGIKENHLDGSVTKFDFYDLKAFAIAVLSQFDIDYQIVKCDNISNCNKYVQAQIIVDQKPVGFIGLKHPNYYKKIKTDIYLLEIDLTSFVNKIKTNKIYQSINTLQDIKRDLTFIVNNNVIYEDIKVIFENIKYLTNVNVKSVYHGDNIIKDHYSISFELTFKQEIQLTKEIIDASCQEIITKAQQQGYIFHEN